VPSVKGDYQISARSKLSGFWSLNRQDNPNNSPLPGPARNGQPRLINSHTIRLNFDETLTPTLLLHFGAGLVDTRINDHTPRFDPVAQLGLTGTNSTLFPVIGAVVGQVNSTLFEGQGGLNYATGSGNQIHLTYRKPTANTSLTWVHNNHTFKFGGEMMVDGYQMFNETYTMGWFNYTPNATGLPALNGVSPASTVGFSYASFLMGAPDSGTDAVPAVTHMGAHSISWFAQDSWKVTRKLTVDYGLRYDFSTYLQDGNGTTESSHPPRPIPTPAAGWGPSSMKGMVEEVVAALSLTIILWLSDHGWGWLIRLLQRPCYASAPVFPTLRRTTTIWVFRLAPNTSTRLRHTAILRFR